MAQRDHALVDRLTRELVDKGKLIEAGFVSYQLMVMPLDAGKTQLEETRMAFFAGAQHLFGSIIAMLDPDVEPTDTDMDRMSSIDTELKVFIEDFKKRHGLTPREH